MGWHIPFALTMPKMVSSLLNCVEYVIIHKGFHVNHVLVYVI